MSAPRPPDRPVVVIGAGVIGLASALALSERGRRVIVVDRGEIDGGCARGSAGHLVPSHVLPLAGPGALRDALRDLVRRDGALAVRWSADPGLWSWIMRFVRSCSAPKMAAGAAAMAPLAELSDKLWDEWLIELRPPCERVGLLDVYARPKPFAAASRRADELARRGIAVDVLDGAQARALEPALRGDVAGAVHLTGDRSIEPTAAMDALVARVREAGVELMANTDVHGVIQRGDRAAAVRVGDAELEAEAVVVAGGVATARIGRGLGERIPVLPARGMSITVERPAAGPRRPLLLGEDHVAVTPISDVLRLSAFFQLGHREPRPSPGHLARLEALTRRRLELDPVLAVRRRWAGLRPVTPDGLPIIGRASRCSNVVIATGHSMTGLSLAPATGRLVAQLVTGEPTSVPVEPFSPARFR